MEIRRSAWLEINLDNLEYNVSQIQKRAPESKLMPVIKANAYGHGATEFADFLSRMGIERFAVSTLNEGIELRKSGILSPILILNYLRDEEIEDLVKYNLTPTVYTYDFAVKVNNEAKIVKKRLRCHINIDTGMSRLGFQTKKDAIDDIVEISKFKNLEIEGIYTHFARADERDKSSTYESVQKFRYIDFVLREKGVNIAIKHISNSAAIIDMRDLSLDYVRPGIILYGYYPSEEVDKGNLSIKPLMKLKAEISNIKYIEKGTGVSYSHSFTADKKTKIATIPLGYADGISRLLQNRLEITYKGKRYRNVGNICMDQFMADMTDSDAQIGDEVTIIGDGSEGALTFDDIAKMTGTINYEILCNMRDRLTRIYFYKDKEIAVRNTLLERSFKN